MRHFLCIVHAAFSFSCFYFVIVLDPVFVYGVIYFDRVIGVFFFHFKWCAKLADIIV